MVLNVSLLCFWFDVTAVTPRVTLVSNYCTRYIADKKKCDSDVKVQHKIYSIAALKPTSVFWLVISVDFVENLDPPLPKLYKKLSRQRGFRHRLHHV